MRPPAPSFARAFAFTGTTPTFAAARFYIDNLTMIRGRHTFKVGGDIRRIRLNNSGNAIRDSSIDYASLTDFIHNSADSLSVLEGEGIRGKHVLDRVDLRPDVRVGVLPRGVDVDLRVQPFGERQNTSPSFDAGKPNVAGTPGGAAEKSPVRTTN